MMNYIFLFFIAILPPIIIGIYLYFRDKEQKEPLRLILKSFFLGWLIVIPILGIHYLLEGINAYWYIEDVLTKDSFVFSFFEAFIMAAMIEEGFKYFAFNKGIWKSKFFDEYYDGILYAALISLGFAALENIFYVYQYGWTTAITRSYTAIPAHAVFGISMGYFFSMAKFSFTHTRRYLWLAFLVPFVLHGLYDLILFEIVRLDETHPMFYPLAISFWVFMLLMLILSTRQIRRMRKKDVG